MKRVLVLLAVLAGVAHAQPAPIVCAGLDTTPGALAEPQPAEADAGVPIPWTELQITGPLLDEGATVHALLETAMQQYATSLTARSWPEIAAVTARYGYQLRRHTVQGTRLVLELAPLPMIRRVDVQVAGQSLTDKLLDDEVRRRMRLRAGSYMPWDPVRQRCALNEEAERIKEYLIDEGYPDAKPELTTSGGKLVATITLGAIYKLDVAGLKIPKPPREHPGDPEPSLALSDAEIRKVFDHRPEWFIISFSSDRFTRTQHQEDLAKLKKLFQQRGFPAVRIISSFDPKTSFDRKSHLVRITLAIDERRQVDIQFEGADGVSVDQMRDQLTFDAAGSADDVEAAASAHALESWFQNSGRFDCHVTWRRDQLGPFDKITFFVDQGPVREVRSVDFFGAHEISPAKLADLVATKEVRLSGALLGTNTAATSDKIAVDVDRIVQAYRRAGYREARVEANVSPEPFGLGDAALTASLALAGNGNDLYVRFTIDEGPPTLLTRVAFKTPTGEPIRDDDPANPKLCSELLKSVSQILAEPALATRADPHACLAVAPRLKFREDDVTDAKDRLRETLFKSGRPRAVVELAAPEQLEPHRASVTFVVSRADKATIGKVVVRGNFKTKESIILGELHFHEGQLLTQDALADAVTGLRNTSLFNAVNVELPDLGGGSSVINAIVRVEERHDNAAEVEVDTGYSTFQSLFVTGIWRQLNILGYGVQLTASGTVSTKIFDLESTLRFPQWLVGHIAPFDFSIDLTALYKQQDTPEFGELTTEQASVALQRYTHRPRTATQSARTLAGGLHYDFRVRSRNVDALRPIGADMDDSQVPISTRTGSLGFSIELDALTDRRGNLVPLAPEDGYRLYGNVSYAAGWLGGQDTFAKISASATRLVPVGTNLVLRADAHYDQGFPLGGAVLLPEVERFFAGGDNTVRGYADDRLATEIVQVGVPPVGGLQQIRVIPAGGNIRAMASLDAQLRIWKIFAGAVFSDAGLITNQWSTVNTDSIRPSVGMGLRVISPFGIGALEYAVPIHPELGDDPRGRIHLYFAARAQF